VASPEARAVFDRIAMEFDERSGLDCRYLNRVAEISKTDARPDRAGASAAASR
jgi:hypothetical protein